MNILVIETETKGHHISSYIRSIIRELKKKKISIFFLTTKEIKKNNYYNFLKKNTKIFFMNRINLSPRRNQIYFLLLQFKYYFEIKNSFKKISKTKKIDHVYLNTLDLFDKALALLGSPFKNINISCLYLNPKFYINYKFFSFKNFKKMVFIKLFFKILKFKNIKNIFFVDPICFMFLQKRKKIDTKKIHLINDLGTASELNKINLSKYDCKKYLKIKQNTFVILVYGSIRENKCLNELFNIVKLVNRNITIVLGGMQDDHTKKTLNNFKSDCTLSNIEVLSINKYIDDTLEKILFKASDLTWIGYSKNFFGSTGVFFLSCYNKTPVIGSNHGVLDWYLKRYKVGFSVDLTNKNKLKKVLINLIDNINKFSFEFSRVNRIHNSVNFGENIVKNILKKN